ncbi:MAG: ABC transporter ATP-binding protein [Leifsonia sp.]|uniref:ABC transporter ATP-binding protein n=1 Tax=Leifsonia sp. TaxID=1870902 RepID=UPI003F7EF17B
MVLSGVTRTYAGGAGIRGVELAVAPGQVHALVGLNGAGKSTLMKVLLGMIRPASGTIRIADVPLQSAGAGVWSRVGHLVEGALIYGELTVTGNLRMSAALHGVPRTGRDALVGTSIEEFGLLRYAHRRARTLSFGNRQRLGLAAALQHDPDFVVLDEPTTGLDPSGTILLREELRRRAGAGAAILISSHHLDEVSRVADRITVINDGRIIGRLTPGGSELERTFFALVLADDEQRRSRGEEAP